MTRILFRRLWGVVKIVTRLAMLLAIVVGVLWLGARSGWRLALIIPAGMVASLPAWRLGHPRSFRKAVTLPYRRHQRRRWYRRRFVGVMADCGLLRRRRGASYVASLGRVELGQYSDRLFLGMVSGQALVDYEKASDRIAAAYGVRSCRVIGAGPSNLWLELSHGDALAMPVSPLPIPANPDLRNVPIGRREDGDLWTLPVLGTHCFVAGATGAGKGSVIWSLLRGLSSSIWAGSTQVWAIDPKGGMELGFGLPLFTRFTGESAEAMCELLEDAVTVMDRRCKTLAGKARLHSPTPEEPMILILIDEMASLTAYVTDRRLRERATAAISALLTKGRAAAVVVIAAAQDPRKEVVSFRSLFPTKVAMRLDTGMQADMVLGDGMHSMGAHCDRIPPSLAGVAFVSVEGVREPMRVRASWIDDDEIIAMSEHYRAPVQPDFATVDLTEDAA